MVAVGGVSGAFNSLKPSRSCGSSEIVSILMHSSDSSIPKDRGSGCDQGAVLIGPPVAEKLPRAPHFRNLVQIQIGGEHFVLIPRSLGNDLSARIGEVTRSV